LILHLCGELGFGFAHASDVERRLRSDAELGPDWNSGLRYCQHRFREGGSTVELDEVGAPFLHDPDCRANGSLGTFLQGSKRKITAHERPLDAAPNCPTGKNHLVERDLELALMPPQVHADRVAD